MIVRMTKMTTMPPNCRVCMIQAECPLCCNPGKNEIKKSCLNKRHKDCPLVEIKEESK